MGLSEGKLEQFEMLLVYVHIDWDFVLVDCAMCDANYARDGIISRRY